ncbi:MAG TPA: DNA gyrase inhibitor YacG [Pyrinomonadaceae bacterium]
MKRCPICGKPAGQQGDEFRPFCSDRCKLLDLGNWVDGNYRVPAHGEQPSPEDLGQHDNSQEDE